MPDSKRHPLVICITGGIACGKSEVGRILGELGFAVCDADRVAHGLLNRKTAVFREVVDYFGEQVLTEEGEISRSALGEIVFQNTQQLKKLNAIVHPAVRHKLDEWICEIRAGEKHGAVLLPLLFESGMQDLKWNAVVCVSSPEKQVFQRLEKRGLSRKAAELRIHSQMPLAEKEQRSDYVLPNNGTLKELEMAVRETVNTIMLER
jgi:dephospho-CoA kinase